MEPGDVVAAGRLSWAFLDTSRLENQCGDIAGETPDHAFDIVNVHRGALDAFGQFAVSPVIRGNFATVVAE